GPAAPARKEPCPTAHQFPGPPGADAHRQAALSARVPAVGAVWAGAVEGVVAGGGGGDAGQGGPQRPQRPAADLRRASPLAPAGERGAYATPLPHRGGGRNRRPPIRLVNSAGPTSK